MRSKRALLTRGLERVRIRALGRSRLTGLLRVAGQVIGYGLSRLGHESRVEDFEVRLWEMLDYQTAQGYVRPEQMGLFRVVASVASIFDALEAAPAPKTPSDSERF